MSDERVERGTPPMSILVVEDDALVGSALEMSLQSAGYRAFLTTNVREAVEVFDRERIDIVLTDLVMPGGSGLELLGEVEQRDPSVPVVILTADDSIQSAAGAVRGDAFDYLNKPVSKTQLLNTVAEAAKSRAERLQERQQRQRLVEEHKALTIRHERTAMVLSILFDRAAEGIIVFDHEARLVNASESFISLIGSPLYEMLDEDAKEFFAPHPSEGDLSSRIRRLIDGPLADGYWRGEVTVMTREGRPVPGRMSLSVCEMPDHERDRTRYMVGIVYIDAAHEELSRQLQAADRLATVGLLAGSAAHEIKNDLGPLLGYMSMIEQGGQRPVQPRMISLMRDSVRRVHEHVDQILAPLRPRVRTRGPVVLGDSLDEILELLKRAGQIRRVRFETHIDEVVVHADKDEVHQILMNLITNALDALGDGDGAERGTIDIRVDTKAQHGIFRIADNGIGMAEHVRSRVFEPFFTTKAASGTGLGLPVVHDIVRALHGTLHLESEENKGTSVTVELPLFRPSEA